MTAAAFVLPLLLLTAQDKKPVVNSGIPADAVKIDEQTFKAKDKDGKSYIYRKTPFGVSRLPEEEFIKQNAAAPLQPVKQAPVKVTDLGTEYKFERAHPFGNQMWKKDKKDLSEDEKGYVEKSKVETVQQSKPAAPAEKKN